MLFALYCLIKTSFCQENNYSRNNRSLRICFYNLENLFDYKNDPLKNDDIFTPDGENHWTKFRYEQKINHIAKVIIALGEWELPDIVGVCEIENDTVIKDLLYNSPLQKQKYQYIHYESPDRRGIDVALLYRSDKFKVVFSQAIPFVFPKDSNFKTRDILYVKGIVPHCQDTLHLFVNHWPSRYGGYAQTIDFRNYAAIILRNYIDSILTISPTAKILCMGDFNDYPYNESIIKYLNAVAPENLQNNSLVHAMYPYFKQNNIGTHKYQSDWGILDQFMHTQNFYNSSSGFCIKGTGKILISNFLLIPDEQNMGNKPFRTYDGMKYSGGFSDHLPIYIDINY